MGSGPMTHQQVCRKILTVLRQRISETLGCPVDNIPELSIGRAINFLFLLRGESLSIGEYHATMAATYALVGDLLWRTPSEFEAKEGHEPEKALMVH